MVWTKNEKKVYFAGGVASLIVTISVWWLLLRNWTPDSWYFWFVGVMTVGLTLWLFGKLAYAMKWVK